MQSRIRHLFYRDLGEAVTRLKFNCLDSDWSIPDCHLRIKVDGNKFEARGRYESKGSVFSGLLGAGKSTEYEIVFRGTIVGRRVHGQVERSPAGSSGASLLGSSEVGKPFAIIFDEDHKSGRVIETINTNSPRYYEIVSVPAAPLESQDNS